MKKSIWFALALITLLTTGCSQSPKVVYQTKYIYLPCKIKPSVLSILGTPKKPNTTPKKVAKTSQSSTNQRWKKFTLPKKSVKFFAPKRYVTRPNQKMNFMVGFNQDDTPFLYLEGEFGTNTYELFLRYIKENDIGFKEIKINSNGGVLASAMKIGAYVYDHKWKTGVDKEMRCLSACTFVYFAGQKKSLQGSAILGLHRPYIPGVKDTPKFIRTVKQKYIRYWNYIHAPKSLYDEMMDVDRDNLFILNRHNINDYIDVTLY